MASTNDEVFNNDHKSHGSRMVYTWFAALCFCKHVGSTLGLINAQVGPQTFSRQAEDQKAPEVLAMVVPENLSKTAVRQFIETPRNDRRQVLWNQVILYLEIWANTVSHLLCQKTGGFGLVSKLSLPCQSPLQKPWPQDTTGSHPLSRHRPFRNHTPQPHQNYLVTTSAEQRQEAANV